MKKIFLLSVILVVSLGSSFSQMDFRPGFIVKNNGDTLIGLVFYAADSKFEKACLFKRFEIAQDFTYSPSEIAAFGFRNGRYFESKNIGRKNTFYECLVKGPISVYIIPGKPGSNIFIESTVSGFFRLNKGTNKLSGSQTFPSYKETLQYIIEKTGLKNSQQTTAAYTAPAIAAMVRKAGGLNQPVPMAFNTTRSVTLIKDYSITSRKPRTTVGITGGYQFLTVNIPGSNTTKYFQEASYNGTFRPVAGLYLNQRFSRKSDLISVDIAFLYLNDTYYGYAEYPNSTKTNRDDIMLGFAAIQTPLALRLTLGKKRNHPYIKAGLYKNWLLEQSYERYSEQQNGNDIYSEYFDDYKLQGGFGFHGGLGIDVGLGDARHISIEALYMTGKQRLEGPSDTYDTEVITNGFSVMMLINL